MTAAEDRLEYAEQDDGLDNWLWWMAHDAADPDVQGMEPPPEPTIHDLDRADRALRRMAHLDAEWDQVDALYEARLAELDAWREGERRRYSRARSWLEMHLRAFHEARLAENPKAKTVRLPAGELRSNAGQPQWQYPDAAAFMEWAERHVPTLVRYPDPQIDRNVAKKVLAPNVANDGQVVVNGEIVPGVQVLPAERSYKLVPNPLGGES